MDRVRIRYKLRTYSKKKKTVSQTVTLQKSLGYVIRSRGIIIILILIWLFGQHLHSNFYFYIIIIIYFVKTTDLPLTNRYLPRGSIWSSSLGIWKIFAAYYSILNNSSSPIVTQRALLVRLPFASAVTMTGLNGSLQLVHSPIPGRLLLILIIREIGAVACFQIVQQPFSQRPW